jgi:uncharacterized SAM-binding protein YcdF (DUF218 family)
MDSLVFLALKKINAGTILPGGIGIGLLLIALSHRSIERWKGNRAILLAWQSGCAIFFCWLASLAIFVGWNLSVSQHDDARQEATPYLVVLGAGLQGKTPSATLQFRLEKVLQILRDNQNIKVIVSGGKGTNEEISEAEAMQAYLVRQGLLIARITLEDRSTSTIENLQFSRRLLEIAGVNLAVTPVGIVTSDFHVMRARRIALQAGYQHAWIAVAPVPWWIRPNSWLREYFSVGLAMMTGRF